MKYDFFAVASDKIALLDIIFKKTDLEIFDVVSPAGQEISQYTSIEAITSKFDLQNGKKFEQSFQLWSPKFRVRPTFLKVDLNPEFFEGQTFRYVTKGYGLIQLYFGGIDENSINFSRLAHLSQKKAFAIEINNEFIGKVNDWDWDEVERRSKWIKSQINKKLAITKLGSNGVMEGAATLHNQGFTFSRS